MIKLFQPILTDDMKSAAIDALQNDIWTNGENVRKFEDKFAHFVNVKYAIGVNSGTSALIISMMSILCINARKRQNALSNNPQNIITTPLSFIATSNAILANNMIPRFVDIDNNLGIMQDIKNDIIYKESVHSLKKIAGILPVALHGHLTDIKEIDIFRNEINENREFGEEMFHITDACQYHAKDSGVIGDAICYSMYPTKNLTICQDGGMICTNNEEIANLSRSIMDCGRSPNNRNLHINYGLTMRMSSVGAAIGIEQLSLLDNWNKKRKKNAELYFNLLKDIPNIRLPIHCTEDSVWHIFEIRSRYRNILKKYLNDCGIECGIHYPIPIHLQPAYKERFGYLEGRYPMTEHIANTTLSLPVHPLLSKDNIKYVCEKISQGIDNIY